MLINLDKRREFYQPSAGHRPSLGGVTSGDEVFEPVRDFYFVLLV